MRFGRSAVWWLPVVLILASTVYMGYVLHEADARSRKPVRDFKAANVCPSTGLMDPDAPCPGHVVDHKEPLCAGGADTPQNMQYQEYQQSLLKDVWERRVCRLMAEVDRWKAKVQPCPP